MPTTKEQRVSVRFRWPKDVHTKLRIYQRQLSLIKEKEVTFEEATIEFIREYEFKRLVG